MEVGETLQAKKPRAQENLGSDHLYPRELLAVYEQLDEALRKHNYAKWITDVYQGYQSNISRLSTLPSTRSPNRFFHSLAREKFHPPFPLGWRALAEKQFTARS